MEPTENNIRIILVKPKDSKNIGSVCRAMKTMGFSRLSLVEGESIDRKQAAITAVHAADLLDRADHFATLEEAIRDAVLVAGVSRRRGKWRKYFALTPEQLAERLASLGRSPSAVVFGNEASGLNAQDLSHCHLAVRIPSSPQFPSLNLSHAVQVITYQIYRRLKAESEPETFHPVSKDDLESFVSLAISALSNIGFFTQGDSENLALFLRDIFARAALDTEEVVRLARIFRRISGLVAHKAIDP